MFHFIFGQDEIKNAIKYECESIGIVIHNNLKDAIKRKMDTNVAINDIVFNGSETLFSETKMAASVIILEKISNVTERYYTFPNNSFLLKFLNTISNKINTREYEIIYCKADCVQNTRRQPLNIKSYINLIVPILENKMVDIKYVIPFSSKEKRNFSENQKKMCEIEKIKSDYRLEDEKMGIIIFDNKDDAMKRETLTNIVIKDVTNGNYHTFPNNRILTSFLYKIKKTIENYKIIYIYDCVEESMDDKYWFNIVNMLSNFPSIIFEGKNIMMRN